MASAGRARVLAPAKVNLRLCILSREDSGYHSLETLFCAVSLADEVVVERGSPGVRLEMEGSIDTGPPERNLAVRAAQAFFAAVDAEPAATIRLAKRIPSAAGLGGGSSDAAAVLRALNALNGEPLSVDDLLRLAIALGADVPFFLCGSPLALAWGRGERLLSLPPLPARPVLIAHPGQSMPTPDAFAAIAAARCGAYAPRSIRIDAAALATWADVASLAANDFEPVVTARFPILRNALASMRAAGADIALLAGSGSSIFATFATPDARDAAAAPLQALGLRCWRAETLARVPGVALA